MTLWSLIVPYVILIDFPEVVTLLKATLPIHTSSITICQLPKLNFVSHQSERKTTIWWKRLKIVLRVSLIPSFSLSLFSHSQWVVWAMRTSTSRPSLPPPYQTTCCPPISPTIHPLDRTTHWTPPPAQLHITPTSCRAWNCLACLVAKMELLCWTKMVAHSARTAAQWPALCLW